jgi:hypothetical protein
MLSTTRWAGLLLMGWVAAGCGGSKTRESVETTTREGKDTSASGVTADRRGTSFVRVVNAIPGADGIAIGIEGRLLFSKVAYQEVTDFQELNENVSRFTLLQSGQDSVLAENREVMGDGARYTLVAAPGDQGPTLRVLRDELQVDSGKTQLRVVNAASGTEAVSVTLQGQPEPVFSNVAPGTEAGYRAIEPTTGALVFKAESGAPLARVDRLELAAGRAYTIVLMGNRDSRLTIVRFADRPVRSAEVSVRP